MPSVRVGEVDVAYGVDGTGDPLPCGHLIPMEQADALAGQIADHAGGR